VDGLHETRVQTSIEQKKLRLKEDNY
jgi:hypothetical protein